MSENNGWPERPGVPLNPERCGAHVFEAGSPDYPVKGPWTLLWAWPEALWVDCFGNMEPPDCMAKFKYVGPCPTPAEHAAALAAEYRRGQEEMRERAATACGHYAEQLAMEWRAGLKASSRLEALSDGADDCAGFISALPIKEAQP